MKKTLGEINFLLIFFLANFLFSQNFNWISTGIGGGGAFFSPAINPHNPQEVYVVSDMSGVYHSSNFGKFWNMLNFNSLEAFTESKVQFTSNPNVMYCINNLDREFIRKTYKSIDGGVSWTALDTDHTNGETFYVFADNQNENRLVVSDYFNIYFSDNSGISFSKIYSNNTGNDDAAYIAGVFWDGSNIYIGTSIGILTSNDSGKNFNFLNLSGIPNEEGLASFCGAKENDTIRFFCVTIPRTNIYPSMFGENFYGFKSLYKLDINTSNQWIKTFSQPENIRPFYVAMAVNNINTIYTSGGDSDIGFPIVYKSIDGGESWESILKTENNQNILTGWSGWNGDYNWWWSGNAYGFAVSQNNPDYVLITDLGYVHGTEDGGKTWKQMYVSHNDENPENNSTPKRKSYSGIGLENTSCWWIHWNDENNIIAGFSDITAIKSEDGGNKWSKNYYNFDYNSTYQFIENASILYAATSSIHDMYESHRLTDNILDQGTGEIMYSNDFGLNWETLHNFNKSVVWMAIDPNNKNKMYASVVHSTDGGIFVSEDIQNGSTSNWRKLNSPQRTEGHPQNIFVLNDGTIICSYSGRINNSDSFTLSSGIFLSNDDGITWSDRSHNDMKYWVRDLYIDPFDENQNTWYVSVFSGWGGAPNDLGGLFRTKDRGLTWEKLNNNYRVATCTINPQNSNQLFFTTESEGLWKSDNINDSTPTFEKILSYPFKHPHRVFFNPYDNNKIWIASFGGGIHYTDIATSIENYSEIDFNFSLLQNYPNPFNPTTTIEYNVSSNLAYQQKREMSNVASDISLSAVTLKIYDILGREVATLVNQKQKPGNYKIEFDASNLPNGSQVLSSGIYFYKLKFGETEIVKKMVFTK